MLASEGVRLVIQAAYFVMIARHLGSTAYGTFASILALVNILGSFAAWGWGSLLVKHVSRDRSRFPTLWGQTLKVIIVSGGLLCMVAVCASHILFGDSVDLSLVCAVALADLIFFKLVTACGSAYQAHERIGRTAGLQVVVSAMRLCAVGLMIAGDAGGTAAQWAGMYCLSTAAAGVIALYVVTREIGAPRFGLPVRWLDVKEGFHFSVTLSSMAIYNDIDKAMLARYGLFDAAGIYSAGYRIVDTVFLPIRSVLFASYAKFFQQGVLGIGATMKLAARLLVPSVAYAALASILLVVCAPLVTGLLGSDFAETASAVRFLAAIPILRAVQVFASDALTGAGYQHWRSSAQFVVAIGNVGLNLWLIPVLSWRGAAISSIVCDAALAASMWTLAYLAARHSRLRTCPVALDVNGVVARNA